jgi:hypothetical protein
LTRATGLRMGCERFIKVDGGVGLWSAGVMLLLLLLLLLATWFRHVFWAFERLENSGFLGSCFFWSRYFLDRWVTRDLLRFSRHGQCGIEQRSLTQDVSEWLDTGQGQNRIGKRHSI